MTTAVDHISMRPVVAASKLIPAGMPVEAMLSAMTIHWSPDTRSDAGIRDFDFSTLSNSLASDSREVWLAGESKISMTERHSLYSYVRLLAEQRQPIYLCGPAGTGKSFMAKQLAKDFGLSYAETPMSPGATRPDLLGRHTIGGVDRAIALATLASAGDTAALEPLRMIAAGDSGSFVPAEFVECYGKGGVFNFEELDSADAGMLLVLNNALAGDELYNSTTGETIKRHPDFIAVSTANTWGMGANLAYGARERLDTATIDRWRMGRVWIPLDESLEEKILYQYVG